MNLQHLDGEEKRFAARLEDWAQTASYSGRRAFSPFLNEREQLLAEALLRSKKIGGGLLYGGYEDAVRRMLGIFPEWEEPDPQAFPLIAVTIRMPRHAEPSHRDILGSLMSLQIKRSCIGDILPQYAQHRCDVFVQQTVAGCVTGELVKIAGYGVQCEIGIPCAYERIENFISGYGTVGSVRIDALVSVLTGLSREKSAALIRAEQVQCNHQTVNRIANAFVSGDVITIRRYGKYKVDSVGSLTKKGRTPVHYSKYI